MARNSWNGIPLLIKLKIEIRELLKKVFFLPLPLTYPKLLILNVYCLQTDYSWYSTDQTVLSLLSTMISELKLFLLVESGTMIDTTPASN